MTKKYKVKQGWKNPFQEMEAGTEGEYIGGYYHFKYKGSCSTGLGNAMMVALPSEMPEWFEEILPEHTYCPPKDLANAIWGCCFDYKDMEKMVNGEKMEDRIMDACKLIEQIYKTTPAEEILPESSNGFVWTDELVKELLALYWDKPVADVRRTLDIQIDRFKESKSPRQYPLDKKEVEKDWEIISVKNDREGIWAFDGSPFDEKMKSGISAGRKTDWEIHSVRRKSDGEVFTVGDYLTELGRYSNENHPIKSMELINGTIGLNYGNGGAIIIQAAKKYSAQPSKERIEVSNFGRHNHCSTINVWQFATSEEIPKEKYPAIKEAIEKILNQ